MRKFMIILLALIFIGCGDSFDPTMCLYKARETYPSATPIPGEKFSYIALDKNWNVHYIKVGGKIKDGISKDVIIIKSIK